MCVCMREGLVGGLTGGVGAVCLVVGLGAGVALLHLQQINASNLRPIRRRSAISAGTSDGCQASQNQKCGSIRIQNADDVS